MNEHEAINYLDIASLSESQEAIEHKIFQLKQELISSCHVPQLIVAKQKKLRQLISISEILNISIEKLEADFEIEDLETNSILDSFNLYHKNRAIILREILANDNLNFLISCSDLLLINLKKWVEKWPLIQSNPAEEIKLSKELESVEMYRLIKELNEKNKLVFSDLDLINETSTIKIEIERLNLIASYFSTIQ
jgi:hypothetical protein